MRHLTTTFIALLLVSTAIIAEEKPKKDDAKKKDSERMNGTWVVVKAELAGKPLPEEVVKTFTIKIKDNNYEVAIGERTDKGTWTLMPKTDPKAMNIFGTEGPNNGKTFKAIYEFKDKQMRVCYSLEEGAAATRPTAFESTEANGLLMIVYKKK